MTLQNWVSASDGSDWEIMRSSGMYHCLGREPGPCIYAPQWPGGPVTPPSTGFPFSRLLRLAGLLWRYSKPLHTGIYHISHSAFPIYVAESSSLKWTSSELLFTVMATLLNLFRYVASGAAFDYTNRNVNIWLSAWGRGARHTYRPR
jgi:hypothetical protein